MDSKDLATGKCVPCHGGSKALAGDQACELLSGTPGWDLSEKPPRLSRTFKFKDFLGSMKFVNEVAAVAEAEGHHPDIEIHWNQVKLSLWTHAIHGLHENDFVMAAKINALQGK